MGCKGSVHFKASRERIPRPQLGQTAMRAGSGGGIRTNWWQIGQEPQRTSRAFRE